MKKFLILLFITSTVIQTNETPKPTLITFKLQSSKILPNFQGLWQDEEEPFKEIYPESVPYVSDYVEERRVEIRQIDENTFQVIGSPLTWDLENQR